MININEEELQCKICYEFLYETVICVKCSNAFCQECAINYKKKAKKYGRVDKCPICGSDNFTFQRCEEIDKLIKKRKHKPLKCQHCKRILFDKEKFEEHIQQCKYQCKFCLKMFDKEDDLLRHIKKNTVELIKALDLMNISRNNTKANNDEKPKKKKLAKKRTNEIIINNELKKTKKENEKTVEEKKEKQKKLKNRDEKKENDQKEEEVKEVKTKKDEAIEEEEEKEDEKKSNDIKKTEQSRRYSENAKKIVKKKIIIKKKIKVPKKKYGTNCNSINNSDNKMIEDDLTDNKMNNTNIKDEDKLAKEISQLNLSAEMSIKDKNTKEDNITKKNPIIMKKINSSIIKGNKKIKTKSEITKKNELNKATLNKFKSKFHIEEIANPKEKEANEEDFLPIKNNIKELELIFPNSDQKIYSNNIIEEEEKINKYVDYLNYPRPESIKPSTIPGDVKLDTEYDLFFCGKPNRIDCICCTEHKCQPGSCMCISCMKLNKRYHKLKSHYLINKAGRACKYSHGYFHCYCNYIHIVHDVGNNIFKPVYRCQGENICKPCEEITLLMETYLPNTICQKLRDREVKKAQF